MVICLERGADLHMAQLMPLLLTVSCFSKIQIVITFWYWLTWVVPDKGLLNVCVCVCVRACVCACLCVSVCVISGNGSVLFWQHCNTFCTSSFMEDVLFPLNDWD